MIWLLWITGFLCIVTGYLALKPYFNPEATWERTRDYFRIFAGLVSAVLGLWNISLARMPELEPLYVQCWIFSLVAMVAAAIVVICQRCVRRTP